MQIQNYDTFVSSCVAIVHGYSYRKFWKIQLDKQAIEFPGMSM